ncbi:MAG: hypothetical protein RMN53_17600 [Anaerolineae bacterium]|nr:hypothetical protein [Anaerolineae bacterium]
MQQPQLASDAELIKTSLGGIFPLFVACLVRLPDVTVRGRNADLALDDRDTMANLMREVRHALETEATGTLKDEAAFTQAKLFVFMLFDVPMFLGTLKTTAACPSITCLYAV